MSRLLPPPDMQERIMLKAWERLEDDITTGGRREALEAVKVVFSQLAPVAKAATAAQLEAAARGASAGASDRTVALTRASERQAARLTPPADTLDATFTPLPRVQRDE